MKYINLLMLFQIIQMLSNHVKNHMIFFKQTPLITPTGRELVKFIESYHVARDGKHFGREEGSLTINYWRGGQSQTIISIFELLVAVYNYIISFNYSQVVKLTNLQQSSKVESQYFIKKFFRYKNAALTVFVVIIN